MDLRMLGLCIKGIVRPKMKMWCLPAYPKGIQYVGDIVSSVEHKQRCLTQTIAVCQSYNVSQWYSRLWEKKNRSEGGGSEVKNYINTVQLLAQTDRFVSKDLNLSSWAKGFNLVLFEYVFFSLKAMSTIDWHYMTDRLQQFELSNIKFI